MSPPSFLLLFFFVLSLSSSVLTATPPSTSSSSLIRSSCSETRFPSLCVRTLSSSPLPINTPADLARATVFASLSTARNATTFLAHLPGPKLGAIRDCKEQLADSAYQLARTGSELSRLRPETFQWQMDNALTWASAAMTNADTCLDGVKHQMPPPATRDAVVSKVSGVYRVTSNALYFINQLASTKGGGM